MVSAIQNGKEIPENTETTTPNKKKHTQPAQR